jgi:hypothetical protein
MAAVEERAIISELERYIREIIVVLEQGGKYGIDFVHFRLDYLCNVVARYIDELHFGTHVLCLIHRESERDCLSTTVQPSSVL